MTGNENMICVSFEMQLTIVTAVRKSLSPYRKDESLNALYPDSTMTEGFAETMSCSWNLLKTW